MIAYLKIHAAGVVFGDAALMLCGPNGAGKTTLTLRLVQEGARVLSDDETWIDPVSTLLHPAERPLLIKDSGLHYFPAYADLATPVEDQGETSWMLDPGSIRDDARADPAFCRAIINLMPGAGPAELRPISQYEMFRQLLEQCMNFPEIGDAAVPALSRVIRSSVLYELRRGDLEHSTKLIKETLLCPTTRSITTTI